MDARARRASVHRGGGRYVALVCGTDVFHHAADRWPDAVDVALLARYARAFANAYRAIGRPGWNLAAGEGLMDSGATQV